MSETDDIPPGYERNEDGSIVIAQETRWSPNPTDWSKFRGSKQRQIVFLQVLAATGRVSTAANSANVSRQGAEQFRNSDKEFAALWQEALDAYAGRVRAEVQRRGMEGVLEDVYHQGHVVGQRRVFSDQLLILEAKRVDREYREAAASGPKVTVTATATAGAVAGAGPALDLENLTRAQRAALRATLRAGAAASLGQGEEPATGKPEASGEVSGATGAIDLELERLDDGASDDA